jgi:parvulin-like peptidyl-prolyl isomerase
MTPAVGDEAKLRVVAATVDNQPIYTVQVERVLGRVLAGREVEGRALAELQAKALEQLVSRRVILAYLEAQHLAASRDDVDLELARIKKQLAQQDLTLAQYLERGQFLDEQDLRTTLVWQIGWARYLDRMTTDENLAKHFQRNRARFDGTQLEVAHLVLAVKPRDDQQALAQTMDSARSIRSDVLAGKTTFAEQARKHSTAPSAPDGGRIGRITRHGSLPEPVAEAAFALSKGEISQPVASTFGVHLIQCLEVHPGQNPLAAVRDAVEADARRFLFDWAVSQQRPKCRVDYTGALPYFEPGTRKLVMQ